MLLHHCHCSWCSTSLCWWAIVASHQPQCWCGTSPTTAMMLCITNCNTDVAHHQPQRWCGTSPTATLMWHITNDNADVPHQQRKHWCATSTTTKLMCHITNHNNDVAHQQPQHWCATSPTTTLMCHINNHNADVPHQFCVQLKHLWHLPKMPNGGSTRMSWTDSGSNTFSASSAVSWKSFKWAVFNS